MTNRQRVVITGLGAITSIGIGKDDFWENILNGKSGISPISSMDTSAHFTHKGGEVKIFEPMRFITEKKANFYSRATQFALAASHLALHDAKLSHEKILHTRIGICIGTTTGSVQVIEKLDEKLINNEPIDAESIYQLPTHSTPAFIAKELALTGTNLMFSTACAAGNYAIGYGFDLIKLGKVDIVIAGASDPLLRVAFTGFNQLSAVAPEKCQPFDMNRKGMMLAEGAGILVLESLESALRRDACIYAEILGYGLSCDAQHMTQPSIEGIAQCMINALREAHITADDIDYISAHGTGTQANDRNECAAIRNVFGSRYPMIPVSSIKSMLGHAMGAASALEAIVCALIVKEDMIPPTINFETPDPECDIDCVPNFFRRQEINIALNNSYAFGGNNASVVFKKFMNKN